MFVNKNNFAEDNYCQLTTWIAVARVVAQIQSVWLGVKQSNL